MPELKIQAVDAWSLKGRVEVLMQENCQAVYAPTDRLLGNLMLLQWAAALLAALWITPQTWIGARSATHIHVWAALFLGAAIAGLPFFLSRRFPGWVVTRHVIAFSQALMSGLLIHLSGGRMETHFHIFGSLAFLALYRDWPVLVTATAVITADHFLRGTFWPLSIFGAVNATPWRWLEHGAWMLFEDTFLCVAIRQSRMTMYESARRLEQLEHANLTVELKVEQRTQELTSEIAEREAAQRETEQLHGKLLEASRSAGMMEVATAVLHNVGNVLNSVNVASSCVAATLKKSKSHSLARAVETMQAPESELSRLLLSSQRGRQLVEFLSQLSSQLAAEQASALSDLQDLQKNIDHIKAIVVRQQTHARVSEQREEVQMADLVRDSLRMNAQLLESASVRVDCEFSPVPSVKADKHKILQILVNLLRNAKQACCASDRSDKWIHLRLWNDVKAVIIEVSDNGIGISADTLTHVFRHGFTTKEEGHGFGLHSGALAAQEMGGSLQVVSAGAGQGATFTLALPFAPTA